MLPNIITGMPPVSQWCCQFIVLPTEPDNLRNQLSRALAFRLLTLFAGICLVISEHMGARSGLWETAPQAALLRRFIPWTKSAPFPCLGNVFPMVHARGASDFPSSSFDRSIFLYVKISLKKFKLAAQFSYIPAFNLLTAHVKFIPRQLSFTFGWVLGWWETADHETSVLFHPYILSTLKNCL